MILIYPLEFTNVTIPSPLTKYWLVSGSYLNDKDESYLTLRFLSLVELSFIFSRIELKGAVKTGFGIYKFVTKIGIIADCNEYLQQLFT